MVTVENSKVDEARSGKCPKRAAAFLKEMASAGAALQWRGKAWHILLPEKGKTMAMSPYRNRMVQNLVSSGFLVAGEDGLLRPRQAPVRAVSNPHESPLSRLARTVGDGLSLSEVQFRAGERLRRDYETAHISQRVTANYVGPEARSDRHWQMSDNAVEKLSAATLSARDRLHLALTAVGPELSGLLLDVCCLASGLEEAERKLSLPRRSARTVLMLGLTRLARHYGLEPPLRHGGPSRIGHWAVADYRPSIPAAEPSSLQP